MGFFCFPLVHVSLLRSGELQFPGTGGSCCFRWLHAHLSMQGWMEGGGGWCFSSSPEQFSTTSCKPSPVLIYYKGLLHKPLDYNSSTLLLQCAAPAQGQLCSNRSGERGCVCCLWEAWLRSPGRLEFAACPVLWKALMNQSGSKTDEVKLAHTLIWQSCTITVRCPHWWRKRWRKRWSLSPGLMATLAFWEGEGPVLTHAS